MIYDLSRVERQHQVHLNEKPPITLRPKRCACGKPTSAKQLCQYKKCVTCVRNAT